MAANTLYYGDNLDILREHVPDEAVDLIYLDPPFNSNRSYNVLFKETDGSAADSQITAFDDTWHWGQSAEATLCEIEQTADPHIVDMIQSIVGFVGRNDVTAYLVMMTVRLIELHRVLKPTGSIYLHCDPTASHYLKVVMDAILGKENFQNEITWKRTTAHSDPNRYGRNTDTILFYTGGDTWTWNELPQPYSDEYKRRFRREDADGRRWTDDNLTAKGLSGGGYDYEYRGFTSFWRVPLETMQRLDREGRLHFTRTGGIRLKRYLDEMKGVALQALWDDIPPINSQAAERLGYPTQKPLALLERIIQASSNEGDLVLDPFCGCGTTICAAQKLGRRWMGIDVTYLAVNLMQSRLRDMFGDEIKESYAVVGLPQDVASAHALALQDRLGFEEWALGLIEARSAHGGKRGRDQGMDGVLFFRDEPRKSKKVIVQVKSGHVQVGHIRDLCHVVEREEAVMGLLVTLEPPSGPMLTEALTAGYYPSPGWNRDYPKIQVRTIEELLDGRGFDLPPANITLAQAQRVKQEGKQEKLL